MRQHTDKSGLTETDRAHLRRCVELAEQALAAGDEFFGSVLAAADGTRLSEDRNHVVTAADPTRHPEIALARWAAQHMSGQDRARATVFTSGEHCPMCSAAHGWVGLGRIVYVHSSAQLSAWLAELDIPQAPVQPLPRPAGRPRHPGLRSGPRADRRDARPAPPLPPTSVIELRDQPGARERARTRWDKTSARAARTAKTSSAAGPQ